MQPFKSEKGSSMMEVLIASTLGVIVLAGTFDLYISSSHGMMGQANAVQMQSDTKAAMDYMVRELRLMNGPPTISASNDQITFVRVEASGYSSGGNTASTLWDTSKSWPTNAYATTSDGAYSVKIILGTGVGEIHPIKTNTATTLTLADTDTWTAIPDSSSLFFIIRNKTFTVLPDQTLRYQIESGAYKLLAMNITALSFTQPDPMSVDISMTAQSQTKDPRIGDYLHYTLTDTVRRRN